MARFGPGVLTANRQDKLNAPPKEQKEVFSEEAAWHYSDVNQRMRTFFCRHSRPSDGGLIVGIRLFGGRPLSSSKSDHAKLEAISKSQAMIEFDLDGTVLTANENFLKVLGYQLSEIVSQHHRMFVEPSYAGSTEYRVFWERLR
jgi:PAS domain-containing protein